MATAVTIDEHRARLEEIKGRHEELDTEYAGQALPEEARAEFETLEEERQETVRLIAELEERKRVIAEQAKKPDRTENGAAFHTPRSGVAAGDDIYDLTTIRSSFADPAGAGSELKDRALRAVERSRPKHPDVDADRAKAHVERMLDQDSPDGKFARYILTVSSPRYKRAYLKAFVHARTTDDEDRALEAAQYALRALSLTGASGGFAVPFELDPTILNTSSGVVNPIRQLARVESIAVDEWRGVTSTGITAAYEAEATEVADNAPTLVQPTVSTEKAHAFIPYSIEVGQDWTGMQDQMAILLADAKDTLEAGKFVSGTGTNEPFGVITGATNTVNATTGQTFTIANLYALIAALPPRYRARGVFMGDLQILNRVRQFETTGGSASGVWVEGMAGATPGADGAAGLLLGKPVYEASEMADTPATGNKFLLFGDFSRYLIVDRVGLSVETIPHLFGANRRPTGQRGIYAYWRNGAKVIDANAFRVLIGIA